MLIQEQEQQECTTKLLPHPLPIGFEREESTIEKYKGLLISIRPDLNMERAAKAKALHSNPNLSPTTLDRIVPVRVLVALLKQWDADKLNWLPVHNPTAVALKNRSSFYFEDIFPADYVSITLNNNQYESIEDLHNVIRLNKERRTITEKAEPWSDVHDIITKCTLTSGVELRAGTPIGHSRLIVSGEGPLFLRYRNDGKPYTLRRGGESLWHLKRSTLTPTLSI